MARKKLKRYHDPLHVPYSQLVVKHKGKEALLLNKELLDLQNCWTNLEAIKAIHKERLKLEDVMKKEKKPIILKAYDELYTGLEFVLQRLWGFNLDASYHRWWHRPKCECPKMDNDDSYPSGMYTKVLNCPLHGDKP